MCPITAFFSHFTSSQNLSIVVHSFTEQEHCPDSTSQQISVCDFEVRRNISGCLHSWSLALAGSLILEFMFILFFLIYAASSHRLFFLLCFSIFTILTFLALWPLSSADHVTENVSKTCMPTLYTLTHIPIG